MLCHPKLILFSCIINTKVYKMENITQKSHSPGPSVKEIKFKFNHLLSSIRKNGQKAAWRTNTHKNNPEELRQFRMNDYEQYIGLKQNIMNTFSVPGSKICQEIFSLNKNLDNSGVQRMEKLLQKLSIKSKFKESAFETDNIDTQFISKMYIIEKSKQRRRQLIMTARKQRKKNQQQSFFVYDLDHIKDFQRSYSKGKRQMSMPIKFPSPKRRKESTQLNLLKTGRQRSKSKNETVNYSQRIRVRSTKHPIVNIFDDQSTKIINTFRQHQPFNMNQTQPYPVYEQRIDPSQTSVQLSGIDLSKIQRHFQKIKSNRTKSRLSFTQN